MLGELLARVVLKECGDSATITRHVTKRGDKVYLAYLQNRHGQTIVALTVCGHFLVRQYRCRSCGTKCTTHSIRRITPKNAIERLENIGVDPVARGDR